MLRSLRVGRLFGIDIYLHWSFWILPLLFIFQTKAFTLITAGLALAFIGFAAFFIVMHEFGHILAARAFGIGTRDVILTPIGGMARLERMSETPSEEILIALAGPAVNLVVAATLGIGTLLFAGSLDLSEHYQLTNQMATGTDLLTMLIFWNLLMAGFNMLPAFPMDGGRIFRGILASVMGRVPATTVAVYVGTAVIGVFGLVGLMSGSILAVPLALFIAFIGHVELMMVRRQEEMRRRQRWEQQMDYAAYEAAAEEAVVPGLPPEPGFSGYTWDARANAWIEWRGGNPVRACRMRAG